MDSISSVQHDRALADSVLLSLKGVKDNNFQGQAFSVSFQFPPKVTSDNRGANWKEVNIKGNEPIPIIADFTAREITLEWTYIVTDSSDGGGNIDGRGGGRWTTERIHRQVYSLRRYFGGESESGIIEKCIVNFKMWSIGGPNPMTFRLVSAGIKHSNTIVAPTAGVVRDGNQSNARIDPQIAYPLRTDITLQLRSWTGKGNSEEMAARYGDNVFNTDLFSQNDLKIAVSGLTASYVPEWY